MNPVATLIIATVCCLLGSLALGGEPPGEQPPLPSWAEALFPDTGEPGKHDKRLRRVGGYALDVEGKTGAVVIVELHYPGLDGSEEIGRARIFLPELVRRRPNARLPLIHHAGYELDDGTAKWLVQRGYVVSTPHAHPLNPLGRGFLLDRAILHAARALPFVDVRRVTVQGGSAGGWMTLMLAADTFPLICAMADVPPIHWGYNAAYIGEQQKLAGPSEGSDKPRMPILQLVGVIAEQSLQTYGLPYEHPGYLAVSPLAHMDTVTCPTLLTFSTADMLVPIEQVGKSVSRPHDPAVFPAGFSAALTARFPSVRGGRTLLDVVSPSKRRIFVLGAPDGIPRIKPDLTFEGQAHAVPLPFATNRTISIVVLDEGPKEPHAGHFKYAWSLDHEPFRRWAEDQGVRPDQLTRAKLERLMKRMLGQPWVSMRIRPGGSRTEQEANLLDYAEAERADILRGLQAYAEDDACAERLGRLYATLPARLKVLGPRLGDGSPSGIRAVLSNVR